MASWFFTGEVRSLSALAAFLTLGVVAQPADSRGIATSAGALRAASMAAPSPKAEIEHPHIARARALRAAGERDAATRLLAAAFAAFAPADRTVARGLLGRLALDRGDLALARRELNLTITDARTAALPEEGAEAAFVLVYLEAELAHDLRAARAALAEGEKLVGSTPRARAKLAYHAALVAFHAEDARRAVHLFRTAEREAERLGDTKLTRHSRELLALTLGGLGRFDAALSVAERGLAPAALHDACERSDAHANAGWLAFMALEPHVQRGEREELESRVDDHFADALEDALRCDDSLRVRNAWVNRGLGAWARRDLADARASLEKARGIACAHDPRLAAWELELEGRIALASQAARAAERVFRRELALAETALDEAWAFRAATGLGQALYAQGRLAAARGAFLDAEERLDRLSRRLPLSLDQSAFLAARDHSARGLVSVELALGRTAQALVAARRTIARSYSQSASEVVDPDALERYRALSSELAALCLDDWQLSDTGLARARAAREPLRAALTAALDAAYGEGTEPHPTAQLTLPSHVVALTFFPLPEGWAAFASTGKGTRAVRLTAVEPRARDVSTDALLAPFSDLIHATTHVEVRSYGASVAIDVHALSFEGRPLIASHTVSYVHDGPRAAQHRGADRAVLVVDPDGTLKGARAERTQVAEALAARGMVVQMLANASRPSLVASLENASFLHFAGHGTRTLGDPLETKVTLAERGALSVADVLALHRAPERVVLAACESGAQLSDDGPAALSLASAFLSRGSRQVIAATRPVVDAEARELVRHLYLAFARGAELGEALASAQRTLLQVTPSADWAAFRLWTEPLEYEP